MTPDYSVFEPSTFNIKCSCLEISFFTIFALFGALLMKYIFLVLRGILMGAADVVPGVSGGTIAFITGIYEELLESIKSIDLAAIKLLFSKGIVAFWKHINGNFLVAVLAGIAIAVVSLAKLLSYLLENYPVLIWAFFFGLIVASAIYIVRQVKKWDIGVVVALILGAAFAFAITLVTRVETPNELWFIFLSGMIAICAMILPGISGSFILVLMGKYEYVLDAVHERNLTVIAVLGTGAVVGLLAFSRVVSWLFKKFHDHTVAVLTGFMIGSLNKVWPWKITLEQISEKHSIDTNVMPNTFETITKEPAQLLPAIGLALLAVVLVFGIERLAANNKA